MNLYKLIVNQSTIKQTLEYLIHLDEDKNYILEFVGFYSNNFISNVSHNIENAFRFITGKNGYNFINQYSIQDLEKRFRESFKVCLDNMTKEEKRNYNITFKS